VQLRFVPADFPKTAARVAPFVELRALAARAGRHEETRAEMKVIGESGGVSVVSIDVGTQSGEDIRNSYLESTLWAVRTMAADIQLSQLWSGPGGEYHTAFEACMFGVNVELALNANGGISRTCKPFLTRGAGAQDFSACPSAEPAGCAETIVVSAIGELQGR
jgi:hypothetical protein